MDYYYHFVSKTYPQWGEVHCGIYDFQVLFLKTDIVRILKPLVENDMDLNLSEEFEIDEYDPDLGSKNLYITAEGVITMMLHNNIEIEEGFKDELICMPAFNAMRDYFSGVKSEEDFLELFARFLNVYVMYLADCTEYEYMVERLVTQVEGLIAVNDALINENAELNDTVNDIIDEYGLEGTKGEWVN